MIAIANEAIDIVGRITALRDKDMAKIQTMGKRASVSAALVLPRLYGQPIVTVATVQKWIGFTRAGVQKVIDRFIEQGILAPKNKSRRYGQSYVYSEYLDIFTGND